MIFWVNYWQEQGDSPVLISGMVEGTKPGLIRIPKDKFRNFIKENGSQKMPLMVEIDETAQTISCVERH